MGWAIDMDTDTEMDMARARGTEWFSTDDDIKQTKQMTSKRAPYVNAHQPVVVGMHGFEHMDMDQCQSYDSMAHTRQGHPPTPYNTSPHG